MDNLSREEKLIVNDAIEGIISIWNVGKDSCEYKYRDGNEPKSKGVDIIFLYKYSITSSTLFQLELFTPESTFVKIMPFDLDGKQFSPYLEVTVSLNF